MKCFDVRENLSLYIDGELERAKAKELESHIEECDECRRELLFFRDMVKAVGEIKEEELPENFHSDMMKKIKNIEKKQYFFRRGIFSKMTTMVAGVVVIICVVFGGKQFYSNENLLQNETEVLGEENETILKEENDYGREVRNSEAKSNSDIKSKKGAKNDVKEKNEIDVDIKSDNIEEDIKRISEFGAMIYVDDKFNSLGEKGGCVSLAVDRELADDIIKLIENGGRKADLKKANEQKSEKVILNINLSL